MFSNKNLKLIFYTLIIFTELIKVATAQEYNSSCIFTPKIELTNISLDLFDSGDYFPELIENSRALYSVRLKTTGNWSYYQQYIQPVTFVQCDGERRTTGTYFSTTSYQLLNESIMTDFVDEGSFYIPEGKKHCQVILTKIYARNTTWEKESGCNIINNLDGCSCRVDGLSGMSKLSEKEVLTRGEFYQKKSLETSQQSNNIAIFFGLLGAATGIGSFLYINKFQKQRVSK